MSRTCWRCCAGRENPRDRVAGFRVMQLLPGIGPATAAQGARPHRRRSPIRSRGLAEFKPPAAAAEHWPAFVETVRLVRSGAAGWPAELDLVRRWYEPHLERMHEDAAMRQADLLQLVQIAATYPSRERFLTELTLDPPDATSDRAGDAAAREDYLILSTIHSAKGQEWKSVFVLNAVDGCMPSDLVDRHHGRNRGGAAAALRRDDAGQGSSRISSCRSGSSCTASAAMATGTSMRRARASSPPDCSNISNRAPGRPPRRRTASPKSARAPVDIRQRVRRTWG